MSDTFRLDRKRGWLLDAAGRRFDPLTRTWSAAATKPQGDAFESVDAIGAVTWLQCESGHPLRVPIGVIGPREATDAQLAAALDVGELLGDCRLTVICGGRQGVMQAVCEGVARVGGLSIGLLPETDPDAANRYVGVAIATGIGEARNALIARAAFCLVAIGQSFGTLSEVALGRQFGKLVVGLEEAAGVEGVQHVATAREAVEAVADAVLATTAVTPSSCSGPLESRPSAQCLPLPRDFLVDATLVLPAPRLVPFAFIALTRAPGFDGAPPPTGFPPSSV